MVIDVAFVTGPYMFYLDCFLLGGAEAGLILSLTYLFPKAYRAKIVATFIVAIPLSRFLDSPLFALLLQLDEIARLRDWPRLFILKAFPSCSGSRPSYCCQAAQARPPG